MFETMSFDTFETLAAVHPRIAVHQSIPGDQITPIGAYLALGALTKGATLLESHDETKQFGHQSFLGFTRDCTVSAKKEMLTVKENNEISHPKTDPLSTLRCVHQKYLAATAHPLAGFAGGLAGHMGYDAIRFFEAIPDENPDPYGIPDFQFVAYRDHINFDINTGNIVLFTIVEVASNPKAAYEKAIERLQMIRTQLKNANPQQSDATQNANKVKPISDNVTTNISDNEFCQLVEKAKHYIEEGDVFQIVLSRVFSKPITTSPFEIYRALRLINPSPYMFYLDNEDYVVLGASPEKLVSAENGHLQTCPLAGTRPRGKTDTEDKALAEALLADKKEIAEHIMLVDLSRNDIGRVSKPGTVTVPQLKQIKRFAHVMHIASLVEGDLADNYDPLDALASVFPLGTLSGAPKIRAMTLIDALEPLRRGLYGGAIGFLDNKGNCDTCIAIRMTVIQNNVASIQSGAGIVFDSVPQAEADETRHKARSVLAAIDLAEGGLS